MRTQPGFTLIELMIVVALAGFIMAYGVPRISQMLQGNRVVTSLNQLSGHLGYARYEAIKRSTCVTTIPLNAAGWEFGWQVFVDNNCNGTLEAGIPPAGERVLKVVDALNIANITLIPSTNNYIIYNRRGNSVNNDGSGALLNNIVLSGYTTGRAIAVASSGHVSIEPYPLP